MDKNFMTLLRIMVIIGDIILVLAALGLCYFGVFKMSLNPVIAIALLYYSYKAWRETGGFMAWKFNKKEGVPHV